MRIAFARRVQVGKDWGSTLHYPPSLGYQMGPKLWKGKTNTLILNKSSVKWIHQIASDNSICECGSIIHTIHVTKDLQTSTKAHFKCSLQIISLRYFHSFPLLRISFLDEVSFQYYLNIDAVCKWVRSEGDLLLLLYVELQQTQMMVHHNQCDVVSIIYSKNFVSINYTFHFSWLFHC